MPETCRQFWTLRILSYKKERGRTPAAPGATHSLQRNNCSSIECSGFDKVPKKSFVLQRTLIITATLLCSTRQLYRFGVVSFHFLCPFFFDLGLLRRRCGIFFVSLEEREQRFVFRLRVRHG